MFRTASLAVALAAAASISAGVALAAENPAPDGRQIILRPQAFHTVDAPPKRASAGDTTITTYRVLDATGTTRLGRAQFVCIATDTGERHQQCTGTIALPDGQLATQGDAAHVAIVGGSGAYAGARGTATGRDRPDRVDVTLHLLDA